MIRSRVKLSIFLLTFLSRERYLQAIHINEFKAVLLHDACYVSLLSQQMCLIQMVTLKLTAVELHLVSIHYVEVTRYKIEITMKRCIHRKIMYYTRASGYFAFVSIQNGKLYNIEHCNQPYAYNTNIPYRQKGRHYRIGTSVLVTLFRGFEWCVAKEYIIIIIRHREYTPLTST